MFQGGQARGVLDQRLDAHAENGEARILRLTAFPAHVDLLQNDAQFKIGEGQIELHR